MDADEMIIYSAQIFCLARSHENVLKIINRGATL